MIKTLPNNLKETSSNIERWVLLYNDDLTHYEQLFTDSTIIYKFNIEEFGNANGLFDRLDLLGIKFNINSVNGMLNIVEAVSISTISYDALLVYWEDELQKTVPAGIGYTPLISIPFGGSKYTGGGAAANARASLINNYNWTITDGGIA